MFCSKFNLTIITMTLGGVFRHNCKIGLISSKNNVTNVTCSSLRIYLQNCLDSSCSSSGFFFEPKQICCNNFFFQFYKQSPKQKGTREKYPCVTGINFSSLFFVQSKGIVGGWVFWWAFVRVCIRLTNWKYSIWYIFYV